MASVIQAIQDAATDPEKWRGALDAVATLCGGRCPVLFTHDCRTRKGEVRIGSQLFDSVRPRYSEYYAERNILMQHGSHLLQPGVVRTSQMMCDESLYLKSEYYNEFVKPMDLEQALGATLLRDGSHTYNLTMFRTYRQAAFDRRELRLLAAVVPHLTRAAILFEEFAAIRGTADTFREVLHQLTDGVLVVDRHGRVVEVNQAAAAMLRAGNGLLSTAEGIRAVLPDDSRVLRAAIAAATTAEGVLPTGNTLVVRRPDGLTPLSIVITPLRQNISFGDRRLACLFVRDAGRPTARTEWLRVAYGLTAAESQVASLLVLGLSTEQLATRTNVSKETIRTHIKRILAKTDTRHRSELVSLALAGSPPVSR